MKKMACMGMKAPMNMDSEMEEGEIVDDLSDISSEEEFLLRQRLEVLENYNNVLERKKAKRSSVGPGKKHKKEDAIYELSEISATEFEDCCLPYKNIKIQKHVKPHHRQRKKKGDTNGVIIKNKEHKKKNNQKFKSKKKLEVKAMSQSSEESEDEYRSRRKKLAEAVVVNNTKNDKTSLSERLQKMLCGVNPEPIKFVIDNKTDGDAVRSNLKTLGGLESEELCIYSPISSQNTDDLLNPEIQNVIHNTKNACNEIDIGSGDENKTVITVSSEDAASASTVIVQEIGDPRDIKSLLLEQNKYSDKDSDDDLELLREHALKTKTVKVKKIKERESISTENKIMSEDEDSDTTELRLICLKSALLKRAIEMKRKQRIQKKLSQSSSLHDDNLFEAMLTDKMNSDNNTDIESVDMDIGSDGDDKLKENDDDCDKMPSNENARKVIASLEKNIPVLMGTKEDELEEDEDLLRAKLLTSLSKNLPNLVNPNLIIRPIESVKDAGRLTLKQPPPDEKRFIINVDSDSEGEHEATKNLTKMHMKLSEQKDFQQKLDMFLKSTRMEVEKTYPPATLTLPDVIQGPPLPPPPKKTEKYVVKAVKNLPKSEQIEYKNLVKRMAELEKIKQARQSSINLNKVPASMKDTLKPRNVTIDASNLTAIHNLEEKIKISRKNIAEESAKMLKLKEEGTKLSQKFKIVATELRNIKTAIALNKKHQRSVQNCLTKIRLHHQMLLRSSLSSTHSNANTISHLNHVNQRLQKENNPKDLKSPLMAISKENFKDIAVLKTVKIGVANDLMKPESKPKPQQPTKVVQPPAKILQHPRLSIELDITNNKKVVTLADTVQTNNKNKDKQSESEDLLENKRHSSHPVVEKGGGTKHTAEPHGPKRRRDSDDYKSPLDAFGSTTPPMMNYVFSWEEDPNAILCPFEVCGDCKDADCKYLHTKTRSK